jgi:hypothetical protein
MLGTHDENGGTLHGVCASEVRWLDCGMKPYQVTFDGL